MEWVRQKIHRCIEKNGRCYIAIHQPWYHRYSGYFYKMMKSDIFLSLDIVQYVSRERQNRQAFYYNDALRRLTLPVWNKREPLSYKKILSPAAQAMHRQIIKMIYKNTPYFLTYEPLFEDVYKKTYESLTQLCDALTWLCASLLWISSEYLPVSKFYKDNYSNENVHKNTPFHPHKKKASLLIDIIEQLVEPEMVKYVTYLPRSEWDANFYLEKKYDDSFFTEKEKMERAWITVSYYKFHHPVYHQFQHSEKTFIPNLWCIDLLFNCWPYSREVLERSWQ